MILIFSKFSVNFYKNDQNAGKFDNNKDIKNFQRQIYRKLTKFLLSNSFLWKMWYNFTSTFLKIWKIWALRFTIDQMFVHSNTYDVPLKHCSLEEAAVVYMLKTYRN